jgi:hypothetical protein
MILPHQEHNSLIATRAFLEDLANLEKLTDVPEKIKLNAKYLLKYFPSKEKLNKLYQGNTIEDISSLKNTEESEDNSNKILNNNQTWDTPGFKWKTEVEFLSQES